MKLVILIVSSFLLIQCGKKDSIPIAPLTKALQPSPPPVAKPETPGTEVPPPTQPPPPLITRTARVICEARQDHLASFIHSIPVHADAQYVFPMIGHKDKNLNIAFLKPLSSRNTHAQSSATALAILNQNLSLIEIDIYSRTWEQRELFTRISKGTLQLTQHGLSKVPTIQPYLLTSSGALIAPSDNHYILTHLKKSFSIEINVNSEQWLPLSSTPDGQKILFWSENKMLLWSQEKSEYITGTHGLIQENFIFWINDNQILRSPLNSPQEIQTVYRFAQIKNPLLLSIQESGWSLALIDQREIHLISTLVPSETQIFSTEVDIKSNGFSYSPWTHQIVFSKGYESGIITFDFNNMVFTHRGYRQIPQSCFYPQVGPEDVEKFL